MREQQRRLLGSGWRARRGTSRALCFGLAALGLLAAPGARAGEGVRVSIASPSAGGKLRDQLHQARIDGSALAEGDGPELFDVMLVIDVSDSTKAASGADVDGDGEVGVNPHNELLPPGAFPPERAQHRPRRHDPAGADRWRRARCSTSLDPRRVRVGVVTFARRGRAATGERKSIDQQDAWLEVPLTTDYGALATRPRRRCSRAARTAPRTSRRASGSAIVELAGLSGAQSAAARRTRSKVMLFLTDGIPTLPVGKGSSPGSGRRARPRCARRSSRTRPASRSTPTRSGPRRAQYPRASPRWRA